MNIEDKSELTAIDAKQLVVKTKWPLAPANRLRDYPWTKRIAACS